MRKIAVLLSALMVLLIVTAPPVSADVPSGSITVTVTGNGTWSAGNLSVSLFPGQGKVFTVTVNSTADKDLLVSPVASIGCAGNSTLTACFTPTNSTLVAGGSSVFNLTITAKGNVPPGLFSFNLTIEADTEIVNPPPSTGVPNYVVLTSAQSGQVVAGDPYDLTATVYDSANTTVSNVSVSWSVLSGSAALSSLGLATNASGQVHAVAISTTVGTSIVRCRAESYSGVFAAINLTWVEDSDDDDDDDDDGDDVVTVPNIRQPISAVAFGEVLVDNALDWTVTIYNDGNAPLVIASVVRSSGDTDFTYIGPLAPFTVGSAGSTVITIRFTPKAAGDASAVFAVTSNDPDTPGVSFTVSGTGKSRGQPAWLVFLIGILIIGGCFGGYFYLKRRRAKKSSLDVLAGGGDKDLGLGSSDDVLDLDT